ncbi:MAG: DUF4134 domain-containing protein [Chitinophagaceae bacterium]|nr:DUF4134 domain-containing protein [Chitinophagaceae bacterium]
MKLRVLNCFLSKRWMLRASVGFVLLLLTISVKAQDGVAGIEEANARVRGYFDVGCNLMYAVGAILGLIGAVRVYQKWSNGHPDTGSSAAAWFGSCVFLVIVATVLKSFFGI